MLVETYEVPEMDCEGNPESEEEAVELIKSLGLKGQEKLLAGDGKTRAPYRKMTAEEFFVYSHVLPSKQNVAAYDAGPIPLRVLQVAAHATQIYGHIQVWCPENADEKDPILVGLNGNDWNPQERFMLARWGEVLTPFKELATKAAAIFRQESKVKIEETLEMLKGKLASLDGAGDDMIVAGKFKMLMVY